MLLGNDLLEGSQVERIVSLREVFEFISYPQIMSHHPLPPTTNPSAELHSLLAHQRQIKDWQLLVNARIYELEEKYLDESTMGNIVKGWDQDAKPSQKKVPIDDKERVFSNSTLQSTHPTDPHQYVQKASTSHKSSGYEKKRKF